MTDAQNQLVAQVNQDPELRRILHRVLNEMREVATRRLLTHLTWEETNYERGAAAAYESLTNLFDRENRDARVREAARARSGLDG